MRNESRMVCALKAYIHLKQGKGKTAIMQNNAVSLFYPKKIIPANHIPNDQQMIMYIIMVQKLFTSKNDNAGSTTDTVLKILFLDPQ